MSGVELSKVDKFKLSESSLDTVPAVTVNVTIVVMSSMCENEIGFFLGFASFPEKSVSCGGCPRTWDEAS